MILSASATETFDESLYEPRVVNNFGALYGCFTGVNFLSTGFCAFAGDIYKQAASVMKNILVMSGMI